jgi:hypothetical protein
MPIHQEKKWETWVLRRLLLGKASPKKKEDCPTDGMWDFLLALNILSLFLCSFFVPSLLVSFTLRYHPIWEREEPESFFIVSSVCVCVCAIVVYPRAAEHRRAV